jgi:hypothetical protein
MHSIFVLQLHNAYWLVDKATASQICDLARVIDAFTENCEKVSGKTSTALRAAFRVQVCDLFVHLYLFGRADHSSGEMLPVILCCCLVLVQLNAFQNIICVM